MLILKNNLSYKIKTVDNSNIAYHRQCTGLANNTQYCLLRDQPKICPMHLHGVKKMQRSNWIFPKVSVTYPHLSSNSSTFKKRFYFNNKQRNRCWSLTAAWRLPSFLSAPSHSRALFTSNSTYSAVKVSPAIDRWPMAFEAISITTGSLEGSRLRR